MQTVILAAGEGTQLRPFTEDKPKTLVGVDGTPMIKDAFDNLIDIGVNEFVVVATVASILIR